MEKILPLPGALFSKQLLFGVNDGEGKIVLSRVLIFFQKHSNVAKNVNTFCNKIPLNFQRCFYTTLVEFGEE